MVPSHPQEKAGEDSPARGRSQWRQAELTTEISEKVAAEERLCQRGDVWSLLISKYEEVSQDTSITEVFWIEKKRSVIKS